MHGWHVTTRKDGSTRCHTWTNPPLEAWIAWPRDAVPDVWTQRLVRLEWQSLRRHTIRCWAWRRRPGRILGTLIERARLDSAVEQLTDESVEAAAIETDTGDGSSVRGLALRDSGTVVLLAPIKDCGDTYPDFADAIDAHERFPAFGPLVPLLWFDSRGFGPCDNVEILLHAWNTAEARVSLELFGLGALGGGTISPEEARRFARLLVQAADWCDAHRSKSGASDGCK